VNCCFVPFAMPGLVGVTAMDTRDAGFTVKAAEPDTFPDAAVIVVVPDATDVASPCEAAALLIVATPVLEELHTTDAVRFWVVLSEYVPVAVNCWFVPLAIAGFAGVTAIETRVAGLTVRVVVPDTAPEVAVIVVVPDDTDVARPRAAPVLLIVATLLLEELQVTVLVRFWVVLSE